MLLSLSVKAACIFAQSYVKLAAQSNNKTRKNRDSVNNGTCIYFFFFLSFVFFLSLQSVYSVWLCKLGIGRKPGYPSLLDKDHPAKLKRISFIFAFPRFFFCNDSM